MKYYAPIAFFVYKRLELTRRVVASLQKNEEATESMLYVFSDGPKTKDDMPKVQEVRDYIRTLSGFKEVHIIESPVNKGLALSNIDGITKVIQEHGKMIMVEDDNEVSRYFLSYLNRGLDLYGNDDRVFSITANMFAVKAVLPECFFLRWADTWGFATWKRAWDLYEKDGQVLLDRLIASGEKNQFDFNGHYKFSDMLKQQIEGRIDSWGVRLYASAFVNNKFTLCPGRSMVKNIGFGVDATHCTEDNEGLSFKGSVENVSVRVSQIPVKEDRYCRRLIVQFFPSPLKRMKRALWARGKGKIKSVLSNICKRV